MEIHLSPSVCDPGPEAVALAFDDDTLEPLDQHALLAEQTKET